MRVSLFFVVVGLYMIVIGYIERSVPILALGTVNAVGHAWIVGVECQIRRAR